MKINKLSFLVFCLTNLWISQLFTQARPPIFPEDIESTSLTPVRFLNKNVRNKSRSKGLDLTYTRVLGGKIKGEDIRLQKPLSETKTLDNISFKIKVPIIRQGNFKMLIGYRYQTEQYQFSNIGPSFTEIFQQLDGKSLKNSGFGLIGSYDINSRISAAARVQALYKGDYEGIANFKNRYAVYQIQATVSVRASEDIEWGVGLNFSKSFRRTIAIPFFMYNRTFNDHWGIELSLPAAMMLRYNISPKSIFLFGPKFNSKSYSITIPNGNENGIIYNLNHSEIRLSLDWEQEIRPWIWFNAEVGFQYNFSTDFEVPVNDAQSFEVEPAHTPFFKIGLFVCPPDSFLNK